MLTLSLFGVPTLAIAERPPVIFTAERQFQLLAYLACRGQWVSRDELAELFWPGRGQVLARSNLRKVLLQARTLAGPIQLEQAGDQIRWSPPNDLQQFEQACDSLAHQRAIELAAPPLMRGMESGLSAGAADWLTFERQRIEAKWRRACEARLKELEHEPEAAVALAETMLLRDPLDDAALQALAKAELALGRAHRAAKALDDHARKLALDLGVEPSSALRELGRMSNSQAQPRANVAPAMPASGLIGRRIELSQIRNMLAQAECRFLTISGPAGIGKSTLARAAAHEIANSDGTIATVVVVLEDLTDLLQVVSRLATAVDVQLGKDRDPPDALIEGLTGWRGVLVLDNIEHLVPALTGFLNRLLAQCAGIKIVATSRTKVSVTHEWLLPLDGLPLPDEGEADAEVLRLCDSVKLFESRALAVAHDFDLSSQAQGVVELVRAVEGLPLAIELAANWARLLSAKQIAVEFAASLELLEPHTGSLRERGVRAGFNQSWQLLSTSECDALTRLAALPGEFSREMAQQVADASLPVIAALVDKSLVRAAGSGRFSLHALLRQFALELAVNKDEVLARHAQFVGHWLGRHSDLRKFTGDLFSELERELAHLRAAWSWALEHRDVLVIERMCKALAYFFESRGMWAEALAEFQRAVDMLGNHSRHEERALCLILRQLEVLQYRSGRLADAEATARRLLKVARRIDDRRGIKSGLNTLGLSLWQRGSFAEARPFFEQAYRRAAADGDHEGVTAFAANLALVDKALGRYEHALEGYKTALDGQLKAHDFVGMVSAQGNISEVLRALQRPAEALPVLDEALVLCEQHRLASVRPFILVNLGLAYQDLGHDSVSLGWLERGLEDAKNHGEPIIEATALLALSHRDAKSQQFARARARLRSALHIADRLQTAAVQIQCVMVFGEILALSGDVAQGAALMHWSAHQAAMNRADQDIARRRLDALRLGADEIHNHAALVPPSVPLHETLSMLRQALSFEVLGSTTAVPAREEA